MFSGAYPKEHGETLIGQTPLLFHLEALLFCNPPAVNKALGIRGNSLRKAEAAARKLIQAGLSTIVFTRSRF